MSLVEKNGYAFAFDPAACRQCNGRCCRGESGRIWINAEELKALSALLGIHPVDCMSRYLTRVDNRLTIRERLTGNGYECCFFDQVSNGCTIYAVRPRQCREFPFWDHCRDDMAYLLRECPGIRLKQDRSPAD